MKYKSLMLCFAWCAFLGASAFGQTLTVTDLFVFPYDAANCSYPYGVQPLAPQMQAGDGNFYGTDASAGFSTGCPNDYPGGGAIFKITSVGGGYRAIGFSVRHSRGGLSVRTLFAGRPSRREGWQPVRDGRGWRHRASGYSIPHISSGRLRDCLQFPQSAALFRRSDANGPTGTWD